MLERGPICRATPLAVTQETQQGQNLPCACTPSENGGQTAQRPTPDTAVKFRVATNRSLHSPDPKDSDPPIIAHWHWNLCGGLRHLFSGRYSHAAMPDFTSPHGVETRRDSESIPCLEQLGHLPRSSVESLTAKFPNPKSLWNSQRRVQESS